MLFREEECVWVSVLMQRKDTVNQSFEVRVAGLQAESISRKLTVTRVDPVMLS